MILYLGSGTEKFAKFVTDQHPNAVLCTNENMDDVINNEFLYTSLFDIDRKNISKLCFAAEKVYLHTEDWTYSDPIRKETIDFYNLFFNDSESPLTDAITHACNLIDQRKTDDKQIWAMGCSYTSSVGVEDHERWATKLSEKMKQPVTILAAPGASITWAADQLLRSDIRSGDKVFWLLTTIHRIDYFSELDRDVKIYPAIRDHEHNLNDRLGEHEYSLLMKLITHKWHCYLSMKSIFQVINYCKKMGVELYIGQGLLNDYKTDEVLIKTLRKHCNFVLPWSMELYYNNFKLDLGTDNCHPGPKTHEKIAGDFYKYVLRN